MDTIIGRQFPEKVIPLINNAKNSIDIVVFDWRWYPFDPAASVQLFNQAIVRAVRRGVRVRGVVNSVEILNILNKQGCQIKKLVTTNLVHAKFMVLDNEIAVIGSHNYTQSAFQMNLEVSVILQGREEIQTIIDFFNNIYG